MRINKFLSLLAIIALLTSCTRENELVKYPDPYHDSFRGRNIRVATSTNSLHPNEIDSLFFDEKGNMTRFSSPHVQKRMLYDSLNFLRKEESMGDTYMLLIFDQTQQRNSIVEVAREVYSTKWDFDLSSVQLSDSMVTVYYLNDERQITRERARGMKRFVEFFYDDQGRLIERIVKRPPAEHDDQKTTYFYRGNSRLLEKIKDRINDHPSTVQYFSEKGLLDSIDYYDGGTTMYSYIYY